ncbi:MAG TPA: anti-sigma F factor [Firmicutes bacterium]|nr:anti-sigma F factor [Bacillota bacterium]
MKAINEVKITLPSYSANEGFARVAAAGFFAQMDPTVEEIADIKTAVSEAVTNCIVHGYQDRIGMIHIHAQMFEGGLIKIKIKDKGCGIPDIKLAMEPMYTTCQTGERAGLGFAVMESFMDKVRVYSAVGRGTTVVLTKRILSRAENG